MPRPIGQRINQVRDIIQKIGPCTAKQVSQHMPHASPDNVHKYCSRAVGYRLVSVDRSGFPKVFSIVDKSVSKPAEAGPEPEIRPEVHHLQGIWR